MVYGCRHAGMERTCKKRLKSDDLTFLKGRLNGGNLPEGGEGVSGRGTIS